MDFSEMVPTEEDLEFLNNYLETEDAKGNLGPCSDYLDENGFCQMCTALMRLDALVKLMRHEDAWIATK